MTSAHTIQSQLQKIASQDRAVALARYFKTEPGQYGAGDKFRGVTVPVVRSVIRPVRSLKDMSLVEIEILLLSEFHEDRLAACLCLVQVYKSSDSALRQQIYDFYLDHSDRINNWDLVDLSARDIVGAQLVGSDYAVLQKLSKSKLIWDRRIAVLACFHNLGLGQAEPALTIAGLLQNDEHDLIQKAVGWMLRELGKRVGRQVEEDWLLENGRYRTLPRTTLRYAIEHFSEDRRQAYLKGEL